MTYVHRKSRDAATSAGRQRNFESGIAQCQDLIERLEEQKRRIEEEINEHRSDIDRWSVVLTHLRDETFDENRSAGETPNVTRTKETR